MPDLPDLPTLQATAATLNAQLTAQRATVVASRQQAALIDNQIATTTTAAEKATLQQQKTALQSRLTGAITELNAITDKLRGSLGPIRIDPCACSADVPILLMPVRIETRFAPPTLGVAGATLNIRIFPDTVHVDRLRRSLTDAERAGGIVYWTAIWTDAAGIAQAWTTLQLAVGAPRAGWVAEATRPTNVDDAPGGAPAFPDAPAATDDSTVARLLPDRFVAVARQSGKEFRATGKPIAGNPEMGAFLPDEQAEDLIVVNGVTLSATARWLADFPTALDQGLAIALPLPSDVVVDDLFVFGVRQSLDPTASTAALDDLLMAHRYSVGLGFVAQGTPSNNLDDSRSGWTGNGAVAAPSLEASVHASGDGAALIAALGINGAAIAGAEGGAGSEGQAASAINSIVWNGSIVNFLDGLDVLNPDGSGKTPRISDANREKIRRLHRDMVRGRGPLPTIRIGKQPYGVLPAGAIATAWVETDAFLGQALSLVRNASTLWSAAAARLPHVTPGTTSSDATMLSLLTMNPVSIGLRGREALASDLGKAFGAVTGAVDTEDELAGLLAGLMAPPPANAGPYRTPFSILGKSKPIGLPYAHESDAAALAALASDQHAKMDVKSVLQALAQLAWSHVQGRVAVNGDVGQLGSVVTNIAGLSVAQATLARQQAANAAQLDAVTLADTADKLASDVSHSATLSAYQPDVAARTSFSALAMSSTSAAGRTEFGLAALPEWFLGQSAQAEVLAALKALAAEPSLDVRRIAVAEALDIASHRLDSWATGLVEGRRRTLRAQTPKGLHIGAFGWLQNIRKGALEDYGYLHAPSIGQAVTAGILRSAYLSHNKNGDVASDGAFAIDLSSARVRDALDLLDAVREGQGLSTALGYRIERGLHDQKLDRFTLNLRTLAPLSAGKLVDAGATVAADIATHLAIANIVDGIALIEKAKTDFAAVVIACNTAPAENPYIDPAAWQGLTADEQGRLKTVIDTAAASLDAVSDVLLAESVHHLAQGNMARAAAAANAAGNGDSPPPVPDVVKTPTTGSVVTHRLLLVVQDGEGWSASQPRALAEPVLERWAASRLGTAASIVVTEDGKTLGGTGLAALDIVYGTADRDALLALVRAKLGLAPDTALVDQADPAWGADRRAMGDVIEAAAVLRTVLAGAIPALPNELCLPNVPTPGYEISAAALADGVARAKVASLTLAERRDALAQAIAADPPLPDAIVAALIGLSDFGIIAPAATSSPDIAQLALEQATQRLAEVAGLIGGTPDTDLLAKLGAALFGEGFAIVATIARVAGAPTDEWDAARSQSATLARPSAIRRWLAEAGAVRAATARFVDSVLLSDALATTPALAAIQITAQSISPPDGWIGSGSAAGVVSSYVVEALGWSDPAKPAVILVLDHFVERLPEPATVASAVAFNAPSPNARPPQSMLLAVAPDPTKAWTTDSVLATLRDTLALAGIRGVALEHQPFAARALPALYQQSWSLKGEDIIDFSKFAMTAIDKTLVPMRFVKEAR